VDENGKKVIFLDRVQDIFNRNVTIPEVSQFVKFTLPENCRNTKKIVQYLEQTIDEPIKVRNVPNGDEVELYSAKNSIDLQTKLVNAIKDLTSNHGIENDQILVLINSDKSSSSISNLKKIGKFDVKALDNKARTPRNSIAYSTINTFKGLEWDIVFVIDTHLIESDKIKPMLYTQASRARHKLYIYTIDTD
jgi:DNA helicase IV